MTGNNPELPIRDIGGVAVVHTPIVKAAQQYAQDHISETAYKHVMRCWLYGVLAISHDKNLEGQVDLEVHALGALLHDLGWDKTPQSTLVSSDKRFEVDGAFAARNFIRNHPDGKDWDEVRVQRVWDAIALHTEQKIVVYKEQDVRVVAQGIAMDFFGPMGLVPDEQYALVGEAFPKSGLAEEVSQTMIWLCKTKPETTYGRL